MRSRSTLVALLAALLLPLGLLTGPAQAADPGDPSPPVTQRGPATDLPVPDLPGVPGDPELPAQAAQRAEEALDTVADLADGDGAADVDATLALRDLALRLGDLPADQRREARRYLARPTDGPANDEWGYTVEQETPICGADICVHYVTSTTDRSTTAFAQKTLDVLEHVHQTYVAAGYRAPLSDGTRGGNAKTDVYLADVGQAGLYGFCTTDKNVPASAAHRDVWAYCVLDNDYRSGQFPVHSALQNLQVTAAHEYFHAVQFAYDIGEDSWFMEGTATWAEDELYDGVNDNRQYLAQSPITQPQRSLDRGSGISVYGSWIFFRWITERFRKSEGGLPVVIRRMWERADSSTAGHDEYSLLAVKRELAQRKLRLADALSSFAAANRMPDRSYTEGKSQRYPRSRAVRSVRVTPSSRRSGTRLNLDHLTSGVVRFVPRSLGGKWVLRVRVNLPNRFKGSAALLTINPRGKAPITRRVRLDKQGNGAIGAVIDNSHTKWAEVAVVNGSDRFRCGQGTVYSCRGRAKDDNLGSRVDAVAVRR